jgi:penicillin-insensitive murein endopeptidase
MARPIRQKVGPCQPGRWLLALALGGWITGCLAAVDGPLTGAVSRGRPNLGWLKRGVAIAERGPGFVRARPGEDTRWGTPSLVSAIERAAHAVHSVLPGEPLRVGDLSARSGGRHSRHGSHRSGRDVDLIPYVTDGWGRSAPGRGFLAFDRFGVALASTDSDVESDSAPIGLRFLDLARNWLLVRALLRDPQAQVQWIFCSQGIKALLLRYAADHESDPELLVRASYILHQPSEGRSHDDHFHVRVMCTPDEIAAGCDDYGPQWPWLPWSWRAQPFSGVVTNDDASLIHALMDELPPP